MQTDSGFRMNFFNQSAKRPTIAGILITVILLLLIQYQPVLFQGTRITDLNRKALLEYDEKHDQTGDSISHPQWLPYIFSGMPLITEILIVPKTDILDQGLLDFFNWFSFALGEPLIYLLIINSVIFSWFIFIYLKQQNLSIESALFPALTLPFLPLFTDLITHGQHSVFYTFTLLPVLLVVVSRLSQKQNALYLCLSVLLFGFMFLRGSLSLSLMIVVFLLFVFLLLRPAAGRGDRWFFLIFLVVAITAGFLLSAVHYFPMIAGSSLLTELTEESLHFENPFKAFGAVIPSFLQVTSPGSDFSRLYMYLGWVIFFMAGIAVFFRRDRQTRFWSSVALICFLLFLSGFMLIKPIPHDILNLVYLFSAFAFFILAAYGIQYLQEVSIAQNGNKKFLRIYFFVFLAVMLLFLIYLIFARNQYLNVFAAEGVFLTIPERIQHHSTLLFDLIRNMFFLIIAFYFIGLCLEQKVGFRSLVLILAAIALLDFGFINRRLVETDLHYNEDTYFNANPTVYFIKSDKSIHRVLPIQNTKCANWYVLHEIESITGYIPKVPVNYQQFLEQTGYRNPFNGFLAKYWRISMVNKKPESKPVPLMEIPVNRLNFDYAMLDMLNVKYIILDSLQITDPRYELVYDTGRQRVYENTRVLPRVFFADTIKVIIGKSHIFDYMKNRHFDPRKMAILEEDPEFTLFDADSNQAEIVSLSAHEIIIDAKAHNNTILVLSEPYYSGGWRAFVDGIETKIYVANSVLRSVCLPAGEHRVVFRYKASGYDLGKWTSLTMLLSILILLLAVLAVYIRNKTQKAL